MEVHIDIADDGVYVDKSAYITNVIFRSVIGQGGEFSFTWARTIQADFLTDLATLKGYRGKLVLFKSDNADSYGQGFIEDIVNITLEECTIIGRQAIKILESYPCNYNPVIYSDFIRTVDTSKLVDIWDDPFVSYDEHIVSIQDVSKLIWEGHPYLIDTRNRTNFATGNSGAATNNEEEGTPDYAVNFDSGDYSKTAVNNHKVYGDYETAGNEGERFFIRTRFLVPKRQGTNFVNVKIKATYKSFITDNFGIAGAADNYDWVSLYFWNNNSSAITNYPQGESGPDKNGVRFTKVMSMEQITDAISDYLNFAKLEAEHPTATAFQKEVTWEEDITQYLTFTEGHYFHTKVQHNDEGLDVFYIDLLWGAGWKTIWAPAQFDYAGGSCFYDFKLTVTYDGEQILPSGQGKIESVTADTINFNTTEHPSPWPLNDAWSTQDIYNISPNLKTILTAMFVSSLADQIFSFSANFIEFETDIIDRTDTPMITVFELYAESAGMMYWEDNLTVYLRSNFVTTSITITETDVHLYPESIKFNVGGNAFTSIIVVGLEERRYELDIAEPITAHDKIKIIYRPDVINAQMAQQVTEGLQNQLETDIYDIEFPMKATASFKSTIRIGKQINISFESGNYVNITNGLIVEVVFYEGPSDQGDFMKIRVTNNYRS